MTAAITSDQSLFCHPEATSAFGANRQTLRILVAEDDEPNQQVLRMMLERRGYTVRVASNGRQALVALDEEPFDLLLLDVRMPDLDGCEVAKLLRKTEEQNPRCDRLPVIALTGMAQTRDRERCMQAGMDEYLSKPLRTAELYSTLDRVLNAGRTKKQRCSAFCQQDVHRSLAAQCTLIC